MSKNLKKYDVFKAWMVEGATFEGKYEFPVIGSCGEMPNDMISFDNSISSKDYQKWVHFYIHDTKFERLWHNPKNYLEKLQKYYGVITPDFSIYRDMPLGMQIWNTYRNRVVGYWLKNNSINIIPNVRWGDERTYDFCFDSIKHGSIVSVGTYGNVKHKLDRQFFLKGFIKMNEVISPKKVIIYGSVFKELEQFLNGENIDYKCFPSTTYEFDKKVTA